MTLLHVVLGFVIEAERTNNFINFYMSRTGFQCIGSLFMTKNMNTLVTCSDCGDMDKMQRKRREKKTLWIGFWIIVYVLES